MTAPTLVEFLRARLDEDEAVAREALLPELGGGTPNFYSGMGAHRDDWNLWTFHVPVARILADVEAKRRIVANMLTLSSQAWQDGDARPVMETCSDRVLRHLALPYADHADYDERWAV